MTEENRNERRLLGATLGMACGLFARDLDLASLISYWGDTAALLVVGAVAGAALVTTRLRPLVFCLTFGLGLLWLAVAYTPLSSWLVSGLVRVDPRRPADAVLVLSTRMQTDGDPTSGHLARFTGGLELVKDGWAPRLIVTELPERFAAQRPYAEAALKRFAPDAQLVVLGPVSNTHDEAVATAEYFKREGLKRVIVATSPTHSWRAAAVVEGTGLEVISAPVRETGYDIETLDYPRERLMAFGSAIHERLGIFVYRRRGWIR